jgi:uncharacterized membrane protein
MKLEKIAFSAILITLLSLNLVIALHTPVISMSPAQWAAGADQDVSLIVKNEGADGIKIVELLVPEKDSTPVYLVKEITNPAGWTYKFTTRIGQTYPYKVIWSTAGTGIESGDSKEFGFKVSSPSEIGEFKWTVTTIDTKESSLTSHLMTSTSRAPLADFDITGEPKEIEAGKLFKITVKAYDKDGDIKTDYTGKINFGSTDEKAILPKSYTFTSTDKGVKTFNVVLKTAGDKVVLISDEQTKLSKISDVIKVVPGDMVSLKIMPEGHKVNPGTKVEFIAVANDLYDNSEDVTEDVSWSIDEGADGEWEQNVYTAGKEGVWTVTGKYEKVMDGTTLTIQKEAVVAPPTVPEIPPTVEEEEEPVIEPVPTVELSISGSDVVSVEAGTNDTTILTVENTGSTDLTGVKLSYLGVPQEWIMVYPKSEDLKIGDSKEFLVAITVPENTSETKTITFTATSNEGASTTMEVTLYAGTAPTGIFIGISKNLLQLAVVIIAVATVVIIVWELWFRK